jgi:hypothetical protein
MGNDAVHVKSREYEAVGKDEIELAVEFTKELLKAVYQLGGLVDRFNQLKAKKEKRT